MSGAAQKVMVIQDASRSINSSAIKWAIDGLSLKPGDELTLLGVLHQINTPSTFPFVGARIPMGYKSKVDTSSMLGADQKMINNEVIRKEREYHNSQELWEINKLYEMNKIAFHRRVVPATSPKLVAVEVAKKIGATWIILDRQLKKHKKYFMERLTCGISRMKRNNSVELLRGPNNIRKGGENSKEIQSGHVKNNETLILPRQEVKQGTFMVSKETLDDDDLFSLEIFPSNFKNNCNNNSNDERALRDTSITTLFSASTSYEASSSLSTVSTSFQTNPEILPGSKFNVEDSSSKIQEDEHAIIQKATEDSDASPSIFSDRKTEGEKSNRDTLQEARQSHISNSDEPLTNESTNACEEARVQNSVCSECRNQQTESDFKNYSYAELHKATDGFSTQNFISEGGFGSVYKGRLKDGQRVAVKQHKHASLQGEKEFRSELNVLSKARHKNVVMLLGSCSEESHRLLVYEYICNGSLDIHLSRNNPNVLSWKNRVEIALGVARGLNYLHQNNIIHRDMRPNNILINHDFEPLLGDFGLAKTQKDEPDDLSQNKVVGTLGYLAPEYAKKGKVSTKTDVYAFGVVLLELITGRTTMDKTLEEKSLVGWARPLLKEKQYPELIDERILDCHDVHELFWMVRVAEVCLRKDPDKRPSMELVEDALKCILNGETVIGIEDFSPTRSSDSSFQRSDKSDNEQEKELDKHVSTDEPPTSMTQITESIPTSMESTSRSLGALLHVEGSKSGKGKFSKKSEKSRSSQILYNEMLD